MTVREMKNDAVRRINLIDESDEKAIQSIWLYVTSAMPLQEGKDQEPLRRAKAKELAHSFLGSFAASRTEKGDFDFAFTVETLAPNDFLTKYFPEEL